MTAWDPAKFAAAAAQMMCYVLKTKALSPYITWHTFYYEPLHPRSLRDKKKCAKNLHFVLDFHGLRLSREWRPIFITFFFRVWSQSNNYLRPNFSTYPSNLGPPMFVCPCLLRRSQYLGFSELLFSSLRQNLSKIQIWSQDRCSQKLFRNAVVFHVGWW